MFVEGLSARSREELVTCLRFTPVCGSAASSEDSFVGSSPMDVPESHTNLVLTWFVPSAISLEIVTRCLINSTFCGPVNSCKCSTDLLHLTPNFPDIFHAIDQAQSYGRGLKMDLKPILVVLFTSTLAWVLHFLYRLYTHRRFFKGLVIPPFLNA